MWHINLCALVVQKGLFKALKSVDNVSKEMDYEEKEDLTRWINSVIQLCLFGEILERLLRKL